MSIPNTPSRFILCALLAMIVLIPLLGILIDFPPMQPDADDKPAPVEDQFDRDFDGEKVDPIEPFIVVERAPRGEIF